MLGKGLESLIPPQKNNGNGNANANGGQPQPNQNSQLQPAGQPSQVQPHIQPAAQPQPAVQPTQPEQVLYPAPPKEIPRDIILNEQLDTEEPSFPPEPMINPSPAALAAKALTEKLQPQSIFQIEVEKIQPNPSQPRRDFNQDAIRDLASSIREFGIIQPIVVTKVEKETPTGVDVEYQLIAGERRFLASKMLGLRVVPAIIRNVVLEREKLELAVIENIQRENLNPVEVARSFQRLQEEFHLTQREIAAKLGKSREAVANSVRLLDLPAYIQEALQKGEISESHGRLLLAVEDPAAQKKIFDDISLYRLTTRDVKERVEKTRKPYGSGSGGEAEDENLPAEVRALKESLSQSLGAPVEIKKGAHTGKISITFYSPEELENILRRLGKEGGMER